MTNKIIEKMAEAIYALQPETITKDRSVGTNMDNDFVTIPYADACNKDNALAKAQAAHACIPEVTAEQLVSVIAATVLRVIYNIYDHPEIDDGNGLYIRDTTAPKGLDAQIVHLLGELKAAAAVKAMLAAYPNGFRVKD